MCALKEDLFTGYCAGECFDPNKCSDPLPACDFHEIKQESDFEYFRNCTQLCGLTLNNLPFYNIALFDAFKNLKRILGQLVITNNNYIFTLSFLNSVTFVRFSLFIRRYIILLIYILFLRR